MAVAMLSLLGLLLATYLWLWKIGFLGGIACGSGSCETVQFSEYAVIFGIPVAFYGVVGYLSILIVSLVGLQPTWIDRREPVLLIAGASGIGVAFTAYLTYLEAAVIEAWCRWCLVSAGLIGVIFLVALVELWARRTTIEAPVADASA
jgi:uncharacterized membrane protein